MSPDGKIKEYHISKNRLDTLVEGIFTFAMTLLVLGVGQPAIPQVRPGSATNKNFIN